MRLLPLPAIAVLAVLSGCGGASTADTGSGGETVPELEPGQQVSITWESYNAASAGVGAETVDQLVAGFEREHPSIDVTVKAPQGTDYTASVQRQLVAGHPPDLVQLVLGDIDYIAEGLRMTSLDELFGSEAVDAHLSGGEHPYHPRAAALGDVDGETYGLPYVFSTPTLFYNADLFEQTGLDPADPPATWAEVREAALAIDRKTDANGAYVDCVGVMYSDWCLTAIVRSSGGRLLSEDGTSLPWSEPEAVEAFEMLRGLADSGAMPNLASQDATEQFMRGQLAMLLTTSARQQVYIGAAEEGGWDLRAGGLPAFGDEPVVPSNSGSGLFILARDPAKQRAAWELAKYLTGPEAQTLITSKMGYLPLRASLLDDPEHLADWAAKQGRHLIDPNVSQLDALEPWVSFPGPNYNQIRTLLTDTTERVVYQDGDVRATLGDAQQRAEELMPHG